MVSRRDFLVGTTAATAALFSQPRLLAAETERFPNPLKIPALLEGTPGAERKSVRTQRRKPGNLSSCRASRHRHSESTAIT